MDIELENLEELIFNLNKKSNALQDIINPILNKKALPRKEILEVCQVTKFSIDIDDPIKIIKKGSPPLPDFIIEHNNIIKGLEHTRIFNPKAKNLAKIKSFIEYTESIFHSIYPSINILVYISMKEGFDYSQSQKKELAQVLVEIVYQMYCGKECKFPDFLTEIRIMTHSLLVFEFEENYLSLEYLPKDILINSIKSKEDKIKEYKKGSNKLKEYWLLLMLDTTSSTSYILNENTDYSVDTIFDRVYLMEDLGSKIIRIA